MDHRAAPAAVLQLIGPARVAGRIGVKFSPVPKDHRVSGADVPDVVNAAKASGRANEPRSQDEQQGRVDK